MTASQRKPRSREGVFFAKEIALTKAGTAAVVGWESWVYAFYQALGRGRHRSERE